MLYCVCTELLLFSLSFVWSNFLISPQSKAEPTLSEWILSIIRMLALMRGTTFYRNFPYFNQDNYELSFGDIFVLTLRISLVVTL